MFSKPDFTKTTYTHARTLITHLDGMCRLNTGDGRAAPRTHSLTLGLLTLCATKPNVLQIQQTCYFVFVSMW